MEPASPVLTADDDADALEAAAAAAAAAELAMEAELAAAAVLGGEGDFDEEQMVSGGPWMAGHVLCV